MAGTSDNGDEVIQCVWCGCKYTASTFAVHSEHCAGLAEQRRRNAKSFEDFNSQISRKPIKPILHEADEIINGARRESYGPVEESFTRIASVWSAVLKQPVTAHQVALCMIGLKLCREANGHGRDNLVDIAGYTALAEKVAGK